MRKLRSLGASPDEEWRVVHQIVVPGVYRQYILDIAHDTPMSGHLGINKTYRKVQNHFYWPSLKQDVAQYFSSCHTCLVCGKINQKIPPVSLKPIPAFDKSFTQVLVDCVGPLQRTKSGNLYLLTVMFASTCFPEAIPLRVIKAKSIIKDLTRIFF